MAKLIDANALLNALPDDLPYKSSVKRVLIQAPNAVTYCFQCKYHTGDDCYHFCRKHGTHCPNDSEYFCAYGQPITNSVYVDE